MKMNNNTLVEFKRGKDKRKRTRKIGYKGAVQGTLGALGVAGLGIAGKNILSSNAYQNWKLGREAKKASQVNRKTGVSPNDESLGAM